MTVQYVDSSMNQSKLYEWMEKFKGRQTNFDDAHSG
jgi:hypothetical protein